MIQEKLTHIIKTTFCLSDDPKPDDLLFSINIDSLGFLELILRCEEAFDVDLDDHDDRISVNWTVADFGRYIESKMQKVNNGVEHPATQSG